MEFSLTEEQQTLAQTARRFLTDRADSDRVREIMATDEGYDPALWRETAQMGWQAMAIPEEYGGAGYGFVETSVLLEEMGRALFPSPFLASAVLATEALLHAGSDEQKKEHLPALAAGETIATLALLEDPDELGPEGVTLTARRDGDAYVLDGTKRFVLAGHTADLYVVVARTADGDAAEGISLLLVPAQADGVSTERLETLDQTRAAADVTFSGARVPAANLLGDEGAGWATVERVLETGAIALACEQVGGAQWCLTTSNDYAKTRMQFGRPIGSFQAIKHRLADLLVQIESAKSAAYYAARVADDDDQTERTVAASMAGSYASEVFVEAAGDTIQIHGGIGFTWEHDAHLYFKRATSSKLLLGTPTAHRVRLANALGY